LIAPACSTSTTSTAKAWTATTTLRAGASVTVTDPGGTVIAIGTLDGGRMNGSGLTRTCTFTFTVKGVHAGKGFYGFEVSHRGIVQVAEADLARSVGLTIGG